MGGYNHDHRVLLSTILAMAFLFCFVVRYLRLIVGIYANLTFKPYPVAKDPKYTPSKDVTVVVPTTFKTPDELVQCLNCIIHQNAPKEVFLVTANANVPKALALCSTNEFKNIHVLGIEKLNKRNQMLKALKEVTTDIVVFADDDVFWPSGYLVQLLAIFENPKVGAGGTRQRVRRNPCPNLWNFFDICYLERRVFNNITTNAIDGSISTLSGRSAAYRTSILATDEFAYKFTHDTWLGRPLNSDDDKFLTRYLYSHGWEIALQTSVVLETSLETSWNYLSQCLRWARAHWRGNFTVMSKESYWCSSKYIWGTYVIYFGQFQTPSLLVDGCLAYLLCKALADASPFFRSCCLSLFGAWLAFTKVVKIIPHFKRHPADLIFLPAMVCFSYFHGFLNLYAVFTMTQTQWGSQNLASLEKGKFAGIPADATPLLTGNEGEKNSALDIISQFLADRDHVSITNKDKKTPTVCTPRQSRAGSVCVSVAA
ncbi:hypothetical protein Q7P37_010206 [Cladosporium fusiforme]